MWDSITKARSLKDIDTTEISLVDKPANKRKFLFFKNQSGDNKMFNDNDTLNLLDTLEAVEAKYVLSETEQTNITKAIQTLSVIPSEDVEALSSVILLLSTLIEAEPKEKVAKSFTSLWPTLTGEMLPITKAGAGVNVHAEADGTRKWPSLAPVAEDDED